MNMHDTPADSPLDFEIFCQVVDNYGDIGVCWRLARSLARDFGLRVRLWVDDWQAFSRLCPSLPVTASSALINNVDVRRWESPFAPLAPAGVVIEAFACTLPEIHIRQMAAMAAAPVWINLEYLSAEDWVVGCHGLASPQPSLPLVKHFFFPGFDDSTGGLLRESGLIAERERFLCEGGRARYLAEIGMPQPASDALLVSLFAYEQPELAQLIPLWAEGTRQVVLLVPEGRVLGDLARALGANSLSAGDRLQRGRLSVAVLPFTEQAGYDRLLWSCDLNFVRGEDSFVRAQWAARPFVWQIYAQQDNAHFDKLDAFLQRYRAGLSPASIAALDAWWGAWNGRGQLASAWTVFAEALPELDQHASKWSAEMAAGSDLSTRLTQFCNHIRSVKG